MPIYVKKTSLDSRGTENYRRGLRAAVRGLWLGALDRDQFWDAMSSTISRGITSAWHAGAADCGIAPDELSPEELAALQKAIDYEHLWIGNSNFEITFNGTDLIISNLHFTGWKFRLLPIDNKKFIVEDINLIIEFEEINNKKTVKYVKRL